MAFIFPRLGRDDENRIYLSVKNANTSVLSVGHAAYHNYLAGSVATANVAQEYAVTHCPTVATSQLNPGLFAGIVADNAINYGEYGKVQQYGEHSAVAISGADGSAPFTDVFTATLTEAGFTNVILKPVAAFGNTTGAAAGAGYLAAMQLATSVAGTQTYASGDINQQIAGLWPGGYAIPLANPSGNVATDGNSTLKAFIKCL